MFVVEIINWIWFILFVCIRKRYWEMIGNHSAFATVEHTFLMQNLNQLGFFLGSTSIPFHLCISADAQQLKMNKQTAPKCSHLLWWSKHQTLCLAFLRLTCDCDSTIWRFGVVLRWKHVRSRRIRTTDWWMDAEWSSVWQADRSRRINETAYADTRHTCGLPKRFIVVFMSNAIRWLANAVLWHAMDAAANAVRRQFRNYQQFDIVLC